MVSYNNLDGGADHQLNKTLSHEESTSIQSVDEKENTVKNTLNIKVSYELPPILGTASTEVHYGLEVSNRAKNQLTQVNQSTLRKASRLNKTVRAGEILYAVAEFEELREYLTVTSLDGKRELYQVIDIKVSASFPTFSKADFRNNAIPRKLIELDGKEPRCYSCNEAEPATTAQPPAAPTPTPTPQPEVRPNPNPTTNPPVMTERKVPTNSSQAGGSVSIAINNTNVTQSAFENVSTQKVGSIEIGDGNGLSVGYFENDGHGDQWTQMDASYNPIKVYRQVRVDGVTIYLFDEQSEENIYLNLGTKKVLVSSVENPQPTTRYVMLDAYAMAMEAEEGYYDDASEPTEEASNYSENYPTYETDDYEEERGISEVEFADDAGNLVGYFIQAGDGTNRWVETDSEGEIRFKYLEIKREETAIHLYDSDRAVTICLDFDQYQILYTDQNTTLAFPIYHISEVY